MFRLFCLFTHDGMYLVRTNSPVGNFWTVSLKELTRESIVSALQDVDPTVTFRGYALLKTINLPHTNLFRACVYVVAEVQDEASFKRRLTDTLNWRWLMFSDITAMKNNGQIDKETHQVVEIVESKDLVSADMMDLKSYVKTEELCQVSVNEFENGLHDAQRALKLSAGFGKKEISMLYEIFMAHCWPFDCMGWVEFNQLFSKIAIRSGQDLPALYRSFDYMNRGSLKFCDVALGLAAMQMNTPHGNISGDQRTRYIFRYYCSDMDGHGVMRLDELETLLRHINRAKPGTYPDPKGEAIRLYTDNFTVDVLLKYVGKLVLRGTSTLLRLEDNFLATFRKILTSDSPRSSALLQQLMPAVVEPPPPLVVPVVVKKENTADVNEVRTTSVAAVATPAVSVETAATQTDVEPVELPPPTTSVGVGDDEAVPSTSAAVSSDADYYVAMHAIRPSDQGPVVEMLVDIGDCLTQQSRFGMETNGSFSADDANSHQRHARDMLKGLDFFSKRFTFASATKGGKSDVKPPRSWNDVNMKAVGRCFIEMCHSVIEIFKRQPRCLQLSAPAYLLGDIHGNYADLAKFEEYLWPLGVGFGAANAVFLGDYVDRGAHQFEVIAYLFAIKILAPDKVFLLRGNHENGHVNAKMFDFRKQCDQKFGCATGKLVWQKANDCFDCMPLAAVVDNKIFCVHGGVPPPSTYDTSAGIIESINRIPVPLCYEVIDATSLAWFLMWNDPVFDDEPVEFDADGFGANKHRHSAKVFSPAALDTFLQRHQFTHVVRAHQVRREGFQVQYNSQLLTVFSSSSYCGFDNSAACILVADKKLKVIRIVIKERHRRPVSPTP